MSAQPNQSVEQGQSHVDRALFNDLLNSVYIAGLCSDDPANLADWCGEMIVKAHEHAAETLINAAVDAIVLDHASLENVLGRVNQLPPAVHGVSDIWVPRSSEELVLEMLKIAVSNPDLYNNLRSVFEDHKAPEALDPFGKQIREFFINIRT